MDVRVLWMQRAVKFLNLTIKKIDVKKNCADLGTKSHTAGEHRRLCEMNYLMSEENVKRLPIAEVNTVGAVGGTSVRSALIALLAALIAEHSEAHEHRVALKSAVAFDLVDATQQSDVLTMRISTFNFWLIAVELLVIILMLACMILLGWKILRELQAVAAATPSVLSEHERRRTESRTVMCQSPATYKWWCTRPEFRALHARDHGCWID
jgi:hypothetical protein